MNTTVTAVAAKPSMRAYLCRADEEACEPQRDYDEGGYGDEPVKRQGGRVEKDIVGSCGNDGPTHSCNASNSARANLRRRLKVNLAGSRFVRRHVAIAPL